MQDELGDPLTLTPARTTAHAAVQLLAKAARANLPPAKDDSHTNLEWSASQMFLTHPLGAGGAGVMVGLSLAPLSVTVLRGGVRLSALDLAGLSVAEAEAWLDERLGELELKPASPVVLNYRLPDGVAGLDRFPSDGAGLAELAAWYSLAVAALQGLADDLPELRPGPGPIRCWPHHFDIATYVGLEAGPPETARGIGVGLSPGDENYDQPYFYVNPWPRLDTGNLPAAIPPGHWHTEGFVGSVATGTEILSANDPYAASAGFLRDSFDAGRRQLGV